jgi:hypothetical protein
MKLKCLIFYKILLIVNSLLHQKLCINCKHFIKKKFEEDRFGKCKVAPYIKNDDSLITGIKENKKIDYYYCSTARSSSTLCNKDGTKYEKK